MASELKVLVVDPIHFKLRNYLEDNFTVVVKQPITQPELMCCIEEYNVLVMRSGAKIDLPLLDRAKNLKAIIRAGTGTENIDLSGVRDKGVLFYNRCLSKMLR